MFYKITSEDIRLLKLIRDGIEKALPDSRENKEIRSTELYNSFNSHNDIKSTFPSGYLFNRFLRKMHKEGVLKQVIPNCNVDTSNPNFYQWRFYKIGKKMNDGMQPALAQSRIGTNKQFESNKQFEVNNGDFVRSRQEQHIYNKLLSEPNLLVYYERPLKIGNRTKRPDFTVANLNTGTVYHWEHFGMIGNVNYEEDMTKKITWYIDKGYDFIENNGRLILTIYKNESQFCSDVETKIKMLKSN